MTASAPLSFDHSREQVEAMMEQGMAFSNVEDVIDASEFSSVKRPRSGCWPGRCATSNTSARMGAYAGCRVDG